MPELPAPAHAFPLSKQLFPLETIPRISLSVESSSQSHTPVFGMAADARKVTCLPSISMVFVIDIYIPCLNAHVL